MVILIVVASLGLPIGALAVRELRSPGRTTVEPIEIDSGDHKDDRREGPQRPRKPKGSKPPTGRREPLPREGSSGADPAPAPPAPAGDDDDDDDDDSDSDDDGGGDD